MTGDFRFLIWINENRKGIKKIRTKSNISIPIKERDPKSEIILTGESDNEKKPMAVVIQE